MPIFDVSRRIDTSFSFNHLSSSASPSFFLTQRYKGFIRVGGDGAGKFWFRIRGTNGARVSIGGNLVVALDNGPYSPSVTASNIVGVELVPGKATSIQIDHYMNGVYWEPSSIHRPLELKWCGGTALSAPCEESALESIGTSFFSRHEYGFSDGTHTANLYVQKKRGGLLIKYIYACAENRQEKVGGARHVYSHTWLDSTFYVSNAPCVCVLV